MQLLEEAGMPPGVINMLPGDGIEVSKVLLAHPDLAGIHFTGSTPVFQHLWSSVGANIEKYRSYPRIVGETGGKDFIVAHPSADVDVLRVAMIRGAFEYQGQKCSAASRAYVPKSVWRRLEDQLVAETEGLPMGDVTKMSNFMGAVIDDRAFAKHKKAIARAKRSKNLDILAGGQVDDSEGWFVRPTVVETDNPNFRLLKEELFGPVVTAFVYPRKKYAETLELVDTGSPYGLTGAVFAQDRAAVETAQDALRYTAGNFYVNDKPTGAVVGQQPFGGGRASGTNDKAGSMWNLIRWVSPRSIKETFMPPRDYRYPFMDDGGDTAGT
jgi:1-pyrroline-5-carboxylate dehydrogenase